MWLSLHSAQAKDKYVEMAVQIKDYEEKKYAYWMAETERTLPLLLKKTLLVMITREDQIKAELVCISHYLLTYN